MANPKTKKPNPADIEHISPKLRPFAVPIDTLQPDQANARKHDEKNLATIVESFKRFGQQLPILVRDDSVVIAGNGRLEAAKKLGWKYLAAIPTDLENIEATAFAIADNRTAELAEWNPETLTSLLETLKDEDAELFDATGFTGDELADLLDDADNANNDADETEPEIPDLFQVIVECPDEPTQKKVHDQLLALKLPGQLKCITI